MSYAYHRPRSIDEALDLASGAPGSRFIAGGTDLLVRMNGNPPPALISLRDVTELGVIEGGAAMRIGAAAPMTDVARHPVVAAHLPALVEAIAVVGSPQIRKSVMPWGPWTYTTPLSPCTSRVHPWMSRLFDGVTRPP